MDITLNDAVRAFWQRVPCGTTPDIVGELPALTKEWFERVEEYRYTNEPFIHSVAQFTRHHGKTVLEIGVGAGTDHLQWARAGCACYGVDLTDAAIELTRARLATYGLTSNLSRLDAEQLPFPDNMFDVVYSWGVIHHSEHPERIIREIRRVLKPGGLFIGMMYHRRSPAALKVWIRYALLKGKPWRSLSDVIWHHVESIGTKAYTVRELHALFSGFQTFSARGIITPYDTAKIPTWISRFFPNDWGWFMSLRAVK